MQEEERVRLSEALKDYEKLTYKNSENIQLVAKEIEKCDERHNQLKSQHSYLAQQVSEQITYTEKSLMDQHD